MKQNDKVRMKDVFVDRFTKDQTKKFIKNPKFGPKREDGSQDQLTPHVSEQYSDWNGRKGQVATVTSTNDIGSVIVWPDGTESTLHRDDYDQFDQIP